MRSTQFTPGTWWRTAASRIRVRASAQYPSYLSMARMLVGVMRASGSVPAIERASAFKRDSKPTVRHPIGPPLDQQASAASGGPSDGEAHSSLDHSRQHRCSHMAFATGIAASKPAIRRFADDALRGLLELYVP